MTTKLTLSMLLRFKHTATALSRRRKKSISALVEELVEREAKRQKDSFAGTDGVWKDDPVTAEELRERAWNRS